MYIKGKEKVFALADCNSFYASCERVFNPKLKNKPVVVLSNNDGCIVARTTEAKKLGIKMGEPLFKAKKTIEKHNVKVFSSNYTLYGSMSNRVMRILELFFPDIEIYSIDEAFMEISSLKKIYNYSRYATKVRKVIFQWTGIPISIGIGETKTLAKVANHIVKNNQEMNGVFDLTKIKNKENILKKIKIKEIWGIGSKLSNFLVKNDICNARDFIQLDNRWVRKNINILGLKTKMELSGIPCYDLDNRYQLKDSNIVKTPLKIPLKEDFKTEDEYYKACSKYNEITRKIVNKHHPIQNIKWKKFFHKLDNSSDNLGEYEIKAKFIDDRCGSNLYENLLSDDKYIDFRILRNKVVHNHKVIIDHEIPFYFQLVSDLLYYLMNDKKILETYEKNIHEHVKYI